MRVVRDRLTNRGIRITAWNGQRNPRQGNDVPIVTQGKDVAREQTSKDPRHAEWADVRLAHRALKFLSRVINAFNFSIPVSPKFTSLYAAVAWSGSVVFRDKRADNAYLPQCDYSRYLKGAADMSTPETTLPELCRPFPERASLYDKLNSSWHERALQLFMLVVFGHWAEHIAQAWQIYVMRWPRPMAGGMLGLWFPCLMQTEILHYSYALVMLVGIWILRKGFTGRALQWWTVSLVIQFWHHFEHALLIAQATLHHNFWGKPVPTSIIQLAVPRVELHLFYNSIVFIPMVVGMYYHVFGPSQEHARCTCARRSTKS